MEELTPPGQEHWWHIETGKVIQIDETIKVLIDKSGYWIRIKEFEKQVIPKTVQDPIFYLSQEDESEDFQTGTPTPIIGEFFS